MLRARSTDRLAEAPSRMMIHVPIVMDGTVASLSVFSGAFLFGGEGELREAELRIESWTLLH